MSPRMADMEFQDKVVAVTGAAGGIGQELCAYFSAEGAAIAALDRSDAVTAVSDRLRHAGGRIEPAVVDIGDADRTGSAEREPSTALAL